MALNLDKHEWEQVVSCDGPGAPAPGPRASGTFTVLEDDKIVLFGGYNGEEFLNDLWVLHITPSADEDALPTYRWESVPTTHEARASLGTATVPVARAGVPSCEWPSPRSGHVGVAIGSLLVMVAGRHRAGRNNDVFLLDAASGWSWYAPAAIGEAFKPRKTHAVGLVGARLFLFGGHSGTDWCSDLHVLDMSALVRQFVPRPSIGQPRSSLICDMKRMVSLPVTSASSSTARRDPVGARGADTLTALAKALDAARGDVPGRRIGTISDVRGGDDGDQNCSGMLDETSDEGLPFSLTSYEQFFHARFGTSCANPAQGDTVGFLAPRSVLTPEVSFSSYSHADHEPGSERSANSQRVPAGDADDEDAVGQVDAMPMAPPAPSSTRKDAAPLSRTPRQRNVIFAKMLDASEISNSSHISAEDDSAADIAHRHSGAPGWRFDASEAPAPASAAPLGSAPILHEVMDDADDSAPASFFSPAPAAVCGPHNPSPLGLGGGLFTDVVFIVDRVRVPLHRCILAARSEYFHAMLTSSQWSETQALGAGIALPDISLPVFVALVQYLYTEEMPPRTELDSVIVPLLAQAQKMGLHALALVCQRHLEEALDVDNASAILDVADSLRVRPLRRAAMRYILDRYEIVSLSPTFVGLREELLREILARRAARAAASSPPQSARRSSAVTPAATSAFAQAAHAGTTAATTHIPVLPTEIVAAPAMSREAATMPSAELSGALLPATQTDAPSLDVSTADERSILSNLLFSPWASAAVALTARLTTLRLQSPRALGAPADLLAGREAQMLAETLSAELTRPSSSSLPVPVLAPSNPEESSSAPSAIAADETAAPKRRRASAAASSAAASVEGARDIAPESAGGANLMHSLDVSAGSSSGHTVAATPSESIDPTATAASAADDARSEATENSAPPSSGSKRRRSLPPR